MSTYINVFSNVVLCNTLLLRQYFMTATKLLYVKFELLYVQYVMSFVY